MTQLVIAFLVALLGFGMIRSYFKQRRYISLTGKVVEVDDSKEGYFQAVIKIPDHDPLTVQYKDSETYELEQEVNCMWDGKNEITVANDFRRSLFFGGLIAIAISTYLILNYFFM